MYLKNTAGQHVTFCMISATDGSPVTGITPTCRRCIDGTFAAGGGTVTEDTGLGFYKYALAQADTNGNNIGLRFTGTGAIDVVLNFVTTSLNPYDTVRGGMSALPNAAPDAPGGLPISDAGGLDLDAQIGTKISAILADTGTDGVLISSGTGTGQLFLDSGVARADVVQVSGGTTTVTNLVTVFNTDFAANYNTTLDQWVVNVTRIEGSDATDQIRDAVVDDATRIDASALNTATGTTVPAILADTNELQTDWTDGGRLDLIADAILADTNELQTDDYPARFTGIEGATFSTATDSLEALRDRGDAAWATATGFSTHSAADVWASATRTLTSAANITSTGGTTVPQTGDSYAIVSSGTHGNAALKTLIDAVDDLLDTEVAAIKSDTAAILLDTGTDGVVVASGSKTGYSLATAPPTVAEIWTTTLTEAYAADGAAFTGAQALFMVWSALSEFAISGTTITAKKLDGSTTSMTFTLDSSTAPTSRTRAS